MYSISALYIIIDFSKIGQSVADIFRFFLFFKMTAVRHLGSVGINQLSSYREVVHESKSA